VGLLVIEFGWQSLLNGFSFQRGTSMADNLLHLPKWSRELSTSNTNVPTFSWLSSVRVCFALKTRNTATLHLETQLVSHLGTFDQPRWLPEQMQLRLKQSAGSSDMPLGNNNVYRDVLTA